MHYKNGRTAKVGDLVKGKGYNIKHEIIGLLLSAQPASSSCNCTVAAVSNGSQIKSHGWRAEDGRFVFQHTTGGAGDEQIIVSEVIASTEYGQLDAFVALDPKTGEILPPEQGS